MGWIVSYRISCDNCKAISEPGKSKAQTRMLADGDGWFVSTDGKDYCPSCRIKIEGWTKVRVPRRSPPRGR